MGGWSPQMLTGTSLRQTTATADVRFPPDLVIQPSTCYLNE